LITFSPSRLATIYLKTKHFIPQRGKKRLETIENKRREIEGESEEGEKVLWCDIGGNGSISYKNHKCGQKTCKRCKKTCRLNVEKLTKVKKTCVLEF